jgi:predicted Holliday junction resolvase-like endonuclease
MESIIKSDVFFFVTTVAVIVVTLIIVIAFTYVIRIASDIKYISTRAKQEADEIVDDLKSARETLKDKGRTISTILSSLWILGSKRKSKKDTKK